ncbi:MAG: hypothetical protein K9N00_00460 [Candidatus Marinimicrobia bacterium]|nr:hypothetical protein [Candidatus Neomarinimicrobiota bacterium]
MKITKLIAIGLFVVAMILNVSVYVDSGNSQEADFSIGDLQVSLFEKAYACGGAIECCLDVGCDGGGSICYSDNGNPWKCSSKEGTVICTEL